jgi:hypothetical protein
MNRPMGSGYPSAPRHGKCSFEAMLLFPLLQGQPVTCISFTSIFASTRGVQSRFSVMP